MSTILGIRNLDITMLIDVIAVFLDLRIRNTGLKSRKTND
jgi:hypothetical protein